ncbi:CPBP family intramembrane glutamic endopeptidase [Clostridium estertheticum]|uniref:CPBP family intramembrane glutamic endopeptidase n=1 Tax=Clostridium estertheticum TaxID=238834 RepID=UPI001CF15CA9|nr:CPBP family intramembrane glutamic endopeptidase [Clostridium estertheticum]MCB2360863.1 CPBP family intramembrane metalloprotease [Clostridium estertheticum]
MEKKIKKSIIIFSFISIFCGWLGVLIDMVLTEQPKGNSLGMLVWLVSPLITAVLIRIFMKDSLRSLGLNPNFKSNLKWYIISFLIFPLITIFILAIGVITKWVDISMFNFTDFTVTFLGTFVMYFIKNIFEELAWRGFLTERLIKLKCSDRKIYSIVAGVWLLWHVPYYLFFLSGNNINGSGIKLLFWPAITLGCWIVMFSELYRITRSIWPCVILHAVINSLVVINDYISIKVGKGILVSYDTGIISLVICICIGIFIRNYRIEKTIDQTKLFEYNT